MKVLTTREFRGSTKNYFALAENERVSIKRGGKYINLVVSDDPSTVFVDTKWVKGFFSIPEQYRCNPFDYVDSGDLFFADKRNIEKIDKGMQEAEEGKVTEMKPGESLDDFLKRVEGCIG